MRTMFAVIIAGLLLIATPEARPVDSSVTDFSALVDRFFEFYFPLHPTAATSAGFHQFDAKLEDYTAAGNEQVARGMKDYLAKFESVDRSKLPPDTVADLDWVISSIRSELLELEDIQPW